MIKLFKLYKGPIYILPLLFILSCDKDENCGIENRIEVYYESYGSFLSPIRYKNDDAKIISGYYYFNLDSLSQDSSITWIMQTELKNICRYDKPKIDFLVALDDPDPTIAVIGAVQEGLNHSQFTSITDPQQGIYYRSTIDYEIKGSYSEAATIYVSISISYTSKGSFNADQDHLFSNLDVVDTRIIYHNP